MGRPFCTIEVFEGVVGGWCGAEGCDFGVQIG